MVTHLQRLLNDCGFGAMVQRNAYLSRVTGREIRFLDQLTFDEAHNMIEEFTERRREESAADFKERDEY